MTKAVHALTSTPIAQVHTRNTVTVVAEINLLDVVGVEIVVVQRRIRRKRGKFVCVDFLTLFEVMRFKEAIYTSVNL